MKFQEQIKEKKIQIGLEIQAQMKEFGINRSKLAELSGLSREQIAWICRGDKKMELGSYLAVLLVINITLNIEKL
jgi:transcriptional regulator with XRE-family HTH domain